MNLTPTLTIKTFCDTSRRGPRNAANTGLAFQREIVTTCAEYERLELALIRKIEPPVKWIGTGKERRAVPQKSDFLDFIGSWWDGLKHVPLHFETKSTGEPRLALNGRDSGLTREQIHSLGLWKNMYWTTFVLWQYQGRVAFVPYADIARALGRGEKSLKWRDYEEKQVRRGPGRMVWDFLEWVK